MTNLQTNTQNQIAEITKIVNASTKADSTKYQYIRAITRFIEAGGSIQDTEFLAEYAKGVSNSERGFLKAVIKLWSNGIMLGLKSEATPDNVNAIQAMEYRIEAINATVESNTQKGEKLGHWLSLKQVSDLMNCPDRSTVKGQRDYIVLGLMVGAGLRRDEVANLRFEQVKQVEGRYMLQFEGKGAKSRVVPIAAKLGKAIDDWSQVNTGANVVCGMRRGDNLTSSISGEAIRQIVAEYGRCVDGVDKLEPHDLRRTYARLGYDAGYDIGQISKLLGHSSIVTTQRYLGITIDLNSTVSDVIPL